MKSGKNTLSIKGIDDFKNIFKTTNKSNDIPKLTSKALNSLDNAKNLDRAKDTAKALTKNDSIDSGLKTIKNLDADDYQELIVRNSDEIVDAGTSARVWDYSDNFDSQLMNFNPGYEIKTSTDTDLYLVQYHSNEKLGSKRSLKFWTTTDEANKFSTVEEYKDKMALLDEWGARDHVSVAKIPAGTDVKYAVGTAKVMADSINIRPGNGVQLLFDHFDENWILDTKVLK